MASVKSLTDVLPRDILTILLEYIDDYTLGAIYSSNIPKLKPLISTFTFNLWHVEVWSNHEDIIVDHSIHYNKSHAIDFIFNYIETNRFYSGQGDLHKQYAKFHKTIKKANYVIPESHTLLCQEKYGPFIKAFGNEFDLTNVFGRSYTVWSE